MHSDISDQECTRLVHTTAYGRFLERKLTRYLLVASVVVLIPVSLATESKTDCDLLTLAVEEKHNPDTLKETEQSTTDSADLQQLNQCVSWLIQKTQNDGGEALKKASISRSGDEANLAENADGPLTNHDFANANLNVSEESGEKLNKELAHQLVQFANILERRDEERESVRNAETPHVLNPAGEQAGSDSGAAGTIQDSSEGSTGAGDGISESHQVKRSEPEVAPSVGSSSNTELITKLRQLADNLNETRNQQGSIPAAGKGKSQNAFVEDTTLHLVNLAQTLQLFSNDLGNSQEQNVNKSNSSNEGVPASTSVNDSVGASVDAMPDVVPTVGVPPSEELARKLRQFDLDDVGVVQEDGLGDDREKPSSKDTAKSLPTSESETDLSNGVGTDPSTPYKPTTQPNTNQRREDIRQSEHSGKDGLIESTAINEEASEVGSLNRQSTKNSANGQTANAELRHKLQEFDEELNQLGIVSGGQEGTRSSQSQSTGPGGSERDLIHKKNKIGTEEADDSKRSETVPSTGSSRHANPGRKNPSNNSTPTDHNRDQDIHEVESSADNNGALTATNELVEDDVARMIREAAENETNPEMKKALWEQYNNYVKHKSK